VPSRTPSTPDLEPDDPPLDDQAAEGVDTRADESHADESQAEDHADDHADDIGTAADDSGHDAAWFEQVVRDHATAVYRFVVRRAGRDEAEDLTADVLAVAWRRRGDVPDGAELPWLYRTAGFVVANHRRKGRPVPIGDIPDEVDPDDPAVRAVQDERVREVLGALGARDRQILLLNAWEGLSGDALAEVLGIGRGGADAALSRARSRLRDAWAAAEA
jgi:RNA polymerase sigma factor (sigma-70 family)